MTHISRIWEGYRALRKDTDTLLGSNNCLLRIGTGVSLFSPGMDEIMADFILAHPEIRIEQTKLDLEAQMHALFAGEQDGVFCLVQNGSYNAETLSNVLKDPKTESFLLARKAVIYLGISKNDPLAARDSAPIYDFCDFSFAFHSNQDMRFKAGTMTPFVALTKRPALT